MTLDTAPYLIPGVDVIEVRGKRYLVTKQTRRSFRISIEDEKGNAFTVDARGVTRLGTMAETGFVRAARDVAQVALGSVVEFTDPVSVKRWPGKYVVIKIGAGEDVNVAKLGGDGNRYVRTMRTHVKVVPV